MTELLCAQVCGGRRAFRGSPIRCVGERIMATGVPEFREVAWRAWPVRYFGSCSLNSLYESQAKYPITEARIRTPKIIIISFNIFQLLTEEVRYSRRVNMREIEKNDFNLNISRYVSTAKPEPIIDLKEVHNDLTSLEEKVLTATKTHNTFLEELGLPSLP
ncbi:hypothetical protein BJAS_P3229 [Bathymodiolus japonicus methanotrophic gill symbiont]|uniref:N-6 DNA methylase n=1 Tax=Bathymodiolus japonicus methanotrophic gill symbiont TaxID=113269 RepID=UPI001B6C92F4|nr:hypothetical protein BJAS_P3229 [Bathymodiolus japonicus methanotrophic gill symbiont]